MASASPPAMAPRAQPVAATTPASPLRFHDRLACPSCHGALRWHAREIVCSHDDTHRFPVTDGGVPILLEEAERRALHGDLETADVMQRDHAPSATQRIARLAKRMVGSTLHQPISPTVRQVFDADPGAVTLVIGSGKKPRHSSRVNLDIAPFANVDVVGSALRLPFQDHSFELAWNTAVLEHVREPQTMIAEIHRVLRPGGHVYTEVPFLQHFHAYPNDFQRYTREGLKQAFAAFQIVEIGVCVGPSSAITALIADWCELLTFSQSRLLNDVVRTIPLALLWPLKHLDRLLLKNPRAHELASGLYVLARKPAG